MKLKNKKEDILCAILLGNILTGEGAIAKRQVRGVIRDGNGAITKRQGREAIAKSEGRRFIRAGYGSTILPKLVAV